MEPLRKCRTAKFFKQDAATGQWEPVMVDPPCSRCPIDLVGRPVPPKTECAVCHCRRMSLYDLASSELKVPDICMVSGGHASAWRPSLPTVCHCHHW